MATTTVPSVDEVRRIAAVDNPVLRNLEITACYSRLAAAFAARGVDGANWCAYATWASKQAGRSIRGEDWIEELGRRLGQGRWLLHPFATVWRRLLRRGLFQPETRLGRLTAQLHTPFDAFERASDAVARGNLRVFEEIGLEFARYLSTCLPDTTAPCEQFLDGLRPGDPPEGQRYLHQAFTRYEQARVTDDATTRTQLTALANIEIAFHEQTRLQPEIREALDSGATTTQDLGDRTLSAVFPGVWQILRRPVAAALGLVAGRVQRAATAVAREIVTESFMVLTLPGRTLALGANLPDEYPEALRSPAELDLRELVARWEPVPPEPDDCGARDWSELDQRMHYIVHCFCAFHAHEELFDPPFTEEQLASLGRGEVPSGDL